MGLADMNTGTFRARRAWLAAVALLSVLHATPVRADSSAADALIQEGLKLRREGKPEQALERFRHAHELAPSPRTYGQMGLVEATLKRWTEAETHLSVALSNLDDTWVQKNRAFLDQALALCRDHVGDLVVTGPAGAEVFVAGDSVGTLPAVPALRVVEGTVEVTANATGFEPFKKSVGIHPGKRTTVTITMSPVVVASPVVTPVEPPAKDTTLPPPPPPPPAPPPPPEESHWHTWAGISLAVVGAGAVGFGAYWISIDGDCQGQPGTPANATTCAGHQAYATKTWGAGIVGVGSAAIVAGAVIFFTRPSPSDTSVAISAGPGSLWLQGRF